MNILFFSLAFIEKHKRLSRIRGELVEFQSIKVSYVLLCLLLVPLSLTCQFMLNVQRNRSTLHDHSNFKPLHYYCDTCRHPPPTTLGKVYKRALVVPSSTPYQRAFAYEACTGTTQVGVLLLSLFDPLFKRSRLHCLDVCST